MRLDGNQARAARAAARREPIEYAIGDTVLAFKAEMPLDILFGVERAYATSLRGLRQWMLAHLATDSECDTSCVDGDSPKVCASVTALSDRLRKIRVDGEPLDEADLDDMWTAVRDAQGVTEGESSSSAESSETAGDTSSETSSDTASTPPASSSKAQEESVA